MGLSTQVSSFRSPFSEYIEMSPFEMTILDGLEGVNLRVDFLIFVLFKSLNTDGDRKTGTQYGRKSKFVSGFNGNDRRKRGKWAEIWAKF